MRELLPSEPCVHAKSALDLLAFAKRNFRLQPWDAPPVIALPGSPCRYSVRDDQATSTRVIVTVGRARKLRCSACFSRLKQCPHVAAVEQCDPCLVSTSEPTRAASDAVDAADSSIVLKPLKPVVSVRIPTITYLPRSLRPAYCFRPATCSCSEGDECECVVRCASCKSVLQSERVGARKIFDLKYSVEVVVCQRRCVSAGCKKPDVLGVDPVREFLFPFSQTAWVSFALLHSFDLRLATRPTTFTAFWMEIAAMYKVHVDEFATKSDFVDWWWQWNASLAVDFDALFTCPICASCGPEATTWVIDGTALGLKKDRLPPPPALRSPESKSKMPCRRVALCSRWSLPDLSHCLMACVMECSSRHDRVLVAVPRLRQLLLRWSANNDCDALSKPEQKELRQLVDHHASFLLPLLDWVRWDSSAIAGVTRLVRALAKPSPLAGLILRPVHTCAVLATLASGQDVLAAPKQWGVLCDNFPLLAELLSAYRNDSVALNILRALAGVLSDKCISFLAGQFLCSSCCWQLRLTTTVTRGLTVCLLPATGSDEHERFPAVSAVSVLQGDLRV